MKPESFATRRTEPNQMDRPEPMKPTTKSQGEVRPIITQAEKESPCEDLLEKILERENLNAAWTATAR